MADWSSATTSPSFAAPPRVSRQGRRCRSTRTARWRRRCEPWPWIVIAEGSATVIPAPDETIDIAASTQVLEYVPDVDAALAEIRRVLRPGGRLLVLDSDWDALVTNADDAARQSAIFAAWRAHAAHQCLPRTL